MRIVSERILDVYYASGEDVEAWQMFKGYTPYFAANMPPVMPLPVADDELPC